MKTPLRLVPLLAALPLLLPAPSSAALPAVIPQQTSAGVQQGEAQEEPRAYADVVTEEAESDEGLFDVHRVGDTVYFQIPDSLFGRDMLLVTRIAKVPVGFPGYSPAGVKTGEQVLRWERRGDRLRRDDPRPPRGRGGEDR